MNRLRRAYHPALAGETAATVRLTQDEAHHVKRVLRLRQDDPLVLFDGCGGEWDGTIVAIDSSGVEVRIGARRESRVESPIHVHLIQGLCRYDRIEWVIQKATELGVRSIQIVPLSRSEVSPPPKNRFARWQRLAVEACKQSGRSLVPELELLTELPLQKCPEMTSIVLDSGPEVPGLGAQLRGPAQDVRLAVGPEGGFTTDEISVFVAAGWHQASLGPRTLRTETAGIVAVAMAQHRWGDLGPC